MKKCIYTSNNIKIYQKKKYIQTLDNTRLAFLDANVSVKFT